MAFKGGNLLGEAAALRFPFFSGVLMLALQARAEAISLLDLDLKIVLRFGQCLLARCFLGFRYGLLEYVDARIQPPALLPTLSSSRSPSKLTPKL